MPGMFESIQHARQHNELISVARLIPPEILEEIFDIYSICCYESRKYTSLHSRRGEVVEWTIVSHVSHHWRNISLSSSRLWSNLCITGSHSMDYLKTCLERSREAPLSVYLKEVFSGDRGEPPLPVLFMIFADHLHRIRSLHVSTKSGFLKDTPSPWRHIHVAPSLKYLTLITNLPGPVSPRLRRSGLREVLLRDTETPSLTHLKILDNAYNWLKASYPRNLVQLELQYIDANKAPYADRTDFLADALVVLKNLPLLQRLDLYDVFPSLAVDYTPLTQTTLSALKIIRLQGYAAPIVKFLHHLILPNNVIHNIYFKYISHEEWDRQYWELNQWLFSRASEFSENPLRKLRITSSEFEDFLSLTAWKDSSTVIPGDTPPLKSPEDHEPDIDISMFVNRDPFDDLPFTIDGFLSGLASAIPITKLEIFDASSLLYFPPPLFQSLRFFPRLAHISLNSDPGLRAFMDSFQMGEKDKECFPALRSLEIAHSQVSPSFQGRKCLEEFCEHLVAWRHDGRLRALKSIRLTHSKRDQVQDIESGTPKMLKSLVDCFEVLEY